MNKFDKIYKDIKSIKIQGAHNIAKAGLEALKYKDQPAKIISARPTEPALFNAIQFSKLTDIETAKNYLEASQKKIIRTCAFKIKDKQKLLNTPKVLIKLL